MSVSGMHSGEKDEAAGKLLEPGDMFGDYTVEKLLGKGGMGAVYLVRAPGGERYAVKLMFPDMVKKGSDYRKRFAREAEFAMKIRHKNLISVYDVGEDPETGLCYIIMDYVPGGSVADRLEKNGPLPMAEAVSIAAQVALALEVAHRHGVVHRDIKPDNIMFDADGTPKLADLGVAKFTDEAHKTTVTTTGMIIGTPAYMAPEQMMDSHHVDARADIYALGVVLYEMLTGKRPTEGCTAVELLAKALKGEPLPDVRTMRPEISAAIAHVLSLMCAPKPENRPATALAAAQLLQKAATGRLVIPKKPPRAADAAARKKKRVIPLMGIVAVAGVVVLCAAVAVGLRSKSAPALSPVPARLVTRTNVVERTILATNIVERMVVATNSVSVSARDTFIFKPPTPKFPMSVHEDSLGWIKRDGALPKGTALRVCHDLSHGGFPETRQAFYAQFLNSSGNNFLMKPCWHDLPSENLDSVNVLLLPSSSAQALYDRYEIAAIDRFLASGGTVVAFVDANGGNLWSMNKFFAPYGLEVFVMDEYGTMDKDRRAVPYPAEPVFSAFKGKSPELRLTTFASPLDEEGAREWSGIVVAGRNRRAVMAARRVGKGNLVFVSSGWYWHNSQRDAQYGIHPVTSEDNSWIWTRLFVSAAQNRSIEAATPIGARAATDAPVTLPVGPITIYTAERWRDNAVKLRDILQQALPFLQRYCGFLDPAEMTHTKYVLTGTGIWGYVNVGPGTLATSATFRGFPDKIGYFSEFVFQHMIRKIVSGNEICLSSYIANVVLADMGFPGEMAAHINEGKKLDPDFSRFKLVKSTTILDSKGNKFDDQSNAILHAKTFSALEEIRRRHPDFIVNYLSRKKAIVGNLTRSQSVGLLTEITGEDCFKIFKEFGIECSRDEAAINPARVQKVPDGTSERNNDAPIELNGPYGLVIKAMPGCREAAEKLLISLKALWLPAALKFYGDPYQGKKPEQSFVVTLERKHEYRSVSYRPGLNEWKGFLPAGKDDFDISLDYLCAAILTRVSEPQWVDFAFYVNFFMDDAVYGRSRAAESVQRNIQRGQDAEGGKGNDNTMSGGAQWDSQMRRRWRLWKAFEEVRAKDAGFMLKYCNMKNRRRAEGKIADRITWLQMAEMMGEAVGFDVVEIFRRNGVEMPNVPGAKNGSANPDRSPDAQKLYDPDSTTVVQKALDVLFPGWKTTQNESRISRPKGAKPLGFVQEFYGRRNLVCTLPFEKGVEPVALYRRMTLPARSPSLKLSFCKARSRTDFRLQVCVNKQSVYDEKVDDWGWRDLSIPLTAWAGKDVAIEVRQYMLPDNPWDRVYWSTLEVTGEEWQAVASNAVKSFVIFPCADTKDMKWKSRAPWRFVTQAPAPSGGKTWMDPEFRDSSWKRTSKTFGAGKDREVIRFAERWRSPSLYLRRHFSWKGDKVKRAEFMLYHACNVKIYLNGTLIINKDDQNDWWEKIDVPVETFAGALQDGDNVLSVEAHAELSARYFDCGLRIETEE